MFYTHIFDDGLNTKELLFKMKIVETEKYFYCKNTFDSTFHALVDCLHTADVWSKTE